VVLKCVKKVEDTNLRPLESECLSREVLIHGRVDHINIPRMYGYYEDEQHLTMILDLVSGEELKQVLVMKRTLPEDECRLISLQVARGLQHLHDMHVVHRDVSPRNILLGEGSKAWLIDLGLAVDMDAQDAGGIEVAGTIGYMPPEAQGTGSGGPHLSAAWDMWALGTILYEMMFGFSPFLPHELYMPTAHVQFPDPSWGLHSSDDLKDVLTALLAKDPAQRLSSGALLSHTWASSDVLATLDAMFAPEIAARAALIEPDEEQGGQQLLAVDLLSSPKFGPTPKYFGVGQCHYLGSARCSLSATLLPRTASIDEEIADAMDTDNDYQSLTALWSAVSLSSAARWAVSAASPSYGSAVCHEPLSPLGGESERRREKRDDASKIPKLSSSISVPTFGSLGLMRRSSSESELPDPLRL
jgi:serine/threonine protein kinase